MKVRLLEKWPIPWIILGLMFLFLPTLAFLQYGWLGQMSEWERQRMRTNLDASLERFSEEFDREIARYYALFSMRLSADIPVEQALRKLLIQFNQNSKDRAVVDAIIVTSELDNGDRTYQEFSSLGLQETEISLEQRKILNGALQSKAKSSSLDRGRIISDPLGIVVPVLRAQATPDAEGNTILEEKAAESLIVLLKRDVFIGTIIRPLAEKYFTRDGSVEYHLKIIDSSSDDAIFENISVGRMEGEPDARGELFSLRMRNFFIVRLVQSESESESEGEETRATANFLWERDESSNLELKEGNLSAIIRRSPSSIWRTEVTHIAGSLEQAVSANRWRNIWLSAGILIVLAAGMVVLAAVTARARRIARQQLEFVAGVTHELRTPLAVIRSGAQNLADSIVTDRERVVEYGKAIEREAERLGAMVENILIYSRISAVHNLSIESVDIKQLLDGLLMSLHKDLENYSCRVEQGIATIDLRVLADLAATESVLRNLILNAAQYGGEDSIINISADRTNHNGKRVVGISVKDNGPGISPGEQREIFKPFTRGAAARNGSTILPGSGIGLSVAIRLARAMQGDILLDAAPGEGSTFTFILPVDGE